MNLGFGRDVGLEYIEKTLAECLHLPSALFQWVTFPQKPEPPKTWTTSSI